ncbi:hypothetical protein [Haloarcula litorea]|uniref:hypothetical protein n=1 Tax=Haloarcula litorea TaxID=3032579 RepID=UPI0023E773A9|nr:hypothetical protein [Halomicroarcula sp. GDY20]
MRQSPNPDRPRTTHTLPTARGSVALVAVLAAALVALSYPAATAALCLAGVAAAAAVRVGRRLLRRRRARSADGTAQRSDPSRSRSSRSD